MIVSAFVLAGPRAGRLDTLTPVAGEPMVARAVRALLGLGLVDHVGVIDLPARADVVRAACAGLPVSVHEGVHEGLAPVRRRTHMAQRAGVPDGHGRIPTNVSDVLLLHDAARPLAPSMLAAAVVEAVRSGFDAAVPVLPMPDTVKQVDLVNGVATVCASPDRAGMRLVQTPQALRREALDEALLPLSPSTVLRMAAKGARVTTVPGHALAFPVRTAFELELAELGMAEGHDGAGRTGN